MLQAADAGEELFRFTSLLLLMCRMMDLIEGGGGDFWEQHGPAFCQLALALVGAPSFQAALADPGQRAEALARLTVASRLLRQVRGGMRRGWWWGWTGVEGWQHAWSVVRPAYVCHLRCIQRLTEWQPLPTLQRDMQAQHVPLKLGPSCCGLAQVQVVDVLSEHHEAKLRYVAKVGAQVRGGPLDAPTSLTR